MVEGQNSVNPKPIPARIDLFSSPLEDIRVVRHPGRESVVLLPNTDEARVELMLPVVIVFAR